ncbi:MAG: hypothetical protein V8Q32_06020 [Anaerotignum faecicola]
MTSDGYGAWQNISDTTFLTDGIKKQIDELRKKKPKTEEELEEIKDQIAKKYADGDKNRKMQNYVNNLELYANSAGRGKSMTLTGHWKSTEQGVPITG